MDGDDAFTSLIGSRSSESATFEVRGHVTSMH